MRQHMFNQVDHIDQSQTERGMTGTTIKHPSNPTLVIDRFSLYESVKSNYLL